MKVLTFTLTCLALTGCASTWYEPPLDGPKAYISFESRNLPNKIISTGSIGKAGGDLCTDAKSQLTTRTNKDIAITAGRETQFINNYEYNQYPMEISCGIPFTFVPVENRRYVSVITMVPKGCTMALFEENGETRREIQWKRACPIRNR